MPADSWVEAHAADDVLRVQPLGFRIGVQLVKVGNSQRQIGVGEQLYRLGLCCPHNKGIRIFLQGPFPQQFGKNSCRLHLFRVLRICPNDDPRRIQVVVKGFGLPQKFRAEQDALREILFPHCRRNGRFDDHNTAGIAAGGQPDNILHRGGIKAIGFAVIIGRRRNDDKIGCAVCRLGVQCGGEVQGLVPQIFFNILVLDGGNSAVYLFRLFRDNVNGGHSVPLCQKNG